MDFSHLSKLEVKDRTAKYPIYQIEGEPVLIMRPANESNKPYFNSVLRKSRRNIRSLQVGAINQKMIDENREQDRILFPKHVIVGWENMPDSKGENVPFSSENCEAFLRALPNWIFDEIRNFASTSANFFGDPIQVGDMASD